MGFFDPVEEGSDFTFIWFDLPRWLQVLIILAVLAIAGSLIGYGGVKAFHH